MMNNAKPMDPNIYLIRNSGCGTSIPTITTNQHDGTFKTRLYDYSTKVLMKTFITPSREEGEKAAQDYMLLLLDTARNLAKKGQLASESFHKAEKIEESLHVIDGVTLEKLLESPYHLYITGARTPEEMKFSSFIFELNVDAVLFNQGYRFCNRIMLHALKLGYFHTRTEEYAKKAPQDYLWKLIHEPIIVGSNTKKIQEMVQ